MKLVQLYLALGPHGDEEHSSISKKRMKFYWSKQLCNINMTREGGFLLYLRLCKLTVETGRNSSFLPVYMEQCKLSPFLLECLHGIRLQKYQRLRKISISAWRCESQCFYRAIASKTHSFLVFTGCWTNFNSSDKKLDLFLSCCEFVLNNDREIQILAWPPIPISCGIK